MRSQVDNGTGEGELDAPTTGILLAFQSGHNSLPDKLNQHVHEIQNIIIELELWNYFLQR